MRFDIGFSWRYVYIYLECVRCCSFYRYLSLAVTVFGCLVVVKFQHDDFLFCFFLVFIQTAYMTISQGISEF